MGCRRARTYSFAVLLILAANTTCMATGKETPVSGTQKEQAADAGGVAPSSTLLSSGPQDSAEETSAQNAPTETLAVTEGIGNIRIGQSIRELAKRMGNPSSKPNGAPPSEDRIEAVWKYADQGLTITLSAPGTGAPLTVEAIVADESCPLQTRSGIGIGSDRAAIEAAYGNLISPDAVEGFVTVDFSDGFLDLTLRTQRKDGEERELVIGMILSALVSFDDGEPAY